MKEKLARGEAAYGLWIWPIEATPNRVEFYGHLGLEFAIIDRVDMTLDLETCLHLVRACDAVGMVPIVRTREHSEATLISILETGAKGIFVTDVQTGDQAQAIVDVVKYQSGKAGEGWWGGAGWCSRAGNYGITQSISDYHRQADDETMIVLMIDAVGVSNLDEILQVEGIDAMGVPSTQALNQYLGHEDSDHPDGERLRLEARAKITASGIALENIPQNAAGARKAIEDGGRLLCFVEGMMLASLFHGVLADLGVSKVAEDSYYLERW